MLRIFGFIIVVVLLVMGIYNGGDLKSFLDVSAILIVLGTAIGGLLMSIGPRTCAALGAIFSTEASEDRLRAGWYACRAARLGALVGGCFAAIAGAGVGILKNLGAVQKTDPHMALALVGFFWAVFLAYFVFRPLQAGIERKLAEVGAAYTAPSETPLDLLVFGVGLVLCSISLVLMLSAVPK